MANAEVANTTANEYVVQGSIGLTRGSMLRIDDGRGVLVYIWEGEVWVTQDRDRQDRMLQGGDWFRLDRNGTAIVHAFRRSVLTLTAPAPESYAERVQVLRPDSATPVVLYSATARRAWSPAGIATRLRRAWETLFSPHARPTTASL